MSQEADADATDPGFSRVASRKKLYEKRLRKGECPQCGIKLFKFGGVLGKKKTPITIQGHVENGRCLACDPYASRNQAILSQRQHLSYAIAEDERMITDSNGAIVPQFLMLRSRNAETSDSATVISGITMDQHLHMSAEYDEVEDDMTVDVDPEEVAFQTTPDNSASGNTPAETTPLPLYPFLAETTRLPAGGPARTRTIHREDERSRPVIPMKAATNYVDSSHNVMSPPPPPPPPPTPELVNRTKFVSPRSSNAQVTEEVKREIGDSVGENETSQVIFESSLTQVEENPDVAIQTSHSGGSTSRQREIFFDSTRIAKSNNALPTVESSNEVDRMPSSASANGAESTSEELVRRNVQADPSPTSAAASPKGEIAVRPETLPLDTSLLGTNAIVAPRRRRPVESVQKLGILDQESPKAVKSTNKQKYNPEQLRELLSFLKESSSSNGMDLCLMEGTNSAVDDITNHLWKGGKQAKLLFHECRGFESLTQIMWSHMVHEPLEERLVELFLACVASDENDGSNDNFEASAILKTEEARNAIEALLFVMQSLSHNKKIQLTACRALVCLATASGLSQGQVDDGSNSGAAAVVLHAMSAHCDTILVQKWSLRALYELCTISANSESNKRTLLTASTLQGGSADGLGAVLECLVRCPPVVEAVRLVWCLSASENARGALDPNGTVLDMLIQVLRNNSTPSSSDPVLMEPLLAAISNLTVILEDRKALSEGTSTDLVGLALRVAKTHRENAGLCTEAIALISNILALGLVDKNSIIEIGGVQFIADLVLDKDDAQALHEECACAMLSLSVGCEKAKAAIRTPHAFAAVKRMSRLYESSVTWQEILCTLISSVVASTDANALACERDAIGAVCFAMTLHTDAERVQEAACVTLRNVSSRNNVNKHLVESDAVELVIDAIARHNGSKVIVLNGCETLWNAGFNGRGYPDLSKALITSVLDAMRSHIDDVEFMHSTMGALLCTLVGADDNKKRFCDAKGLEVVTSVILIHRQTEGLLIKACGLLASLTCYAALVPAVVEAGAIACTTDAIRDKSKSTGFLTSAAQFLTNAILAMPDQCDEVGMIVGVLIERMRESPHESRFQSEACRLILALASLSDPVRSRILALDCTAVLMATLESNNEPDVQNNALEAFNELAVSTSKVRS